LCAGPPILVGPSAPAVLCARRIKATSPLPLHFLWGRRPRRPCAQGLQFLWSAAGPGGLVRAPHEGNEPAAPPFFVEGRRPRRPSAQGLQFLWRAAGPGGLMAAGLKGSEPAAPPFFCGGPPAPAALCARRMRAASPLPLHFLWRAAGPGGLVRASHEGNEPAAFPLLSRISVLIAFQRRNRYNHVNNHCKAT